MKKRTVVIAVVVLIGITACVMGVLIRSEAQKRARYEQAMRLADAGDTGGAYKYSGLFRTSLFPMGNG